jgi:hypothetical protein
MGWSVKRKVFSFSVLCFHLLVVVRLNVKVAFWKRLSGDTPDFCPGLTCYPYIPTGVHYIVSNSGQRSSRRPIFKSGHLKAQGSVRSPLRSKSFMIRSKKGLFTCHRLAPDKPWALLHVRCATRRIGLCGSATRAPGRPWIADASRAWPGTACARLLFPG